MSGSWSCSGRLGTLPKVDQGALPDDVSLDAATQLIGLPDDV
jgi:hypothetical protein